MFRDFQLTFTPECADFVKTAYREAQLIIEYGSGGSTLFAAAEHKKIITVESSSEWLLELMAAYKEKDLPGDIIPLWANIGPTKEWGYPATEELWQQYPAYPKIPWEYCAEHQLNPSTVLIDGRFRVAAFITCCLNTKQTIQILFDDFVERPEYHCVKEIAEPDFIIDKRMAVFNIKPGAISAETLLKKLSYFYNPE